MEKHLIGVSGKSWALAIHGDDLPVLGLAFVRWVETGPGPLLSIPCLQPSALCSAPTPPLCPVSSPLGLPFSISAGKHSSSSCLQGPAHMPHIWDSLMTPTRDSLMTPTTKLRDLWPAGVSYQAE